MLWLAEIFYNTETSIESNKDKDTAADNTIYQFFLLSVFSASVMICELQV